MGILDYLMGLFREAPTYEQKAKYLDGKATAVGDHLQWRTSVVDLLKTMGQDSSLAARIILAKELGYHDVFTGTADQNVWLHQKLMDHLLKVS